MLCFLFLCCNLVNIAFSRHFSPPTKVMPVINKTYRYCQIFCLDQRALLVLNIWFRRRKGREFIRDMESLECIYIQAKQSRQTFDEILFVAKDSSEYIVMEYKTKFRRIHNYIFKAKIYRSVYFLHLYVHLWSASDLIR